ncbi:MAG TPA: MarR family transcriptional regulator [Marmoricola sp.]
MTEPVVAALEVELSLLARHHLHSSQNGPERLLDRSGYHLLGRLELGPLTLKQLADAFRLDPSTVNRQVGALLRAGLVERITDPGGSTARALRPTRQGRAMLRRDRAVLRRQVGEVLAGWSDQDVDDLRGLLERFNRSIEAREGRAWPRA